MMERLRSEKSWNQSTYSLPLPGVLPVELPNRGKSIQRSDKAKAQSSEVIRRSSKARAIQRNVDEEEEPFISIGIDLGTTFSGVAWALSTSPKNVNIVSSWESDLPGNSTLHKVPSILTYNSKGTVTSWGYKLDPHRHHISWFKLLLSDKAIQVLGKEQEEKSAKLKKLLQRFNKEPLDVVADYLQCLWNHATEAIQIKIGRVLWENLRIRIVLTVPAIWDHKAQELAKRAAEMAGLMARTDTTFEMIGEPESAAMAVFEEMSLQTKRNLKVGDVFVVCDAGGGTVDLISYKIETMKPLKLAMCSEATGDLCGAVFLDAAFENLLRTMIEASEFDGLGTRSKRKMMNDWEHGIKRSFRIAEAENTKWHVDIPGYSGVQVAESDVGADMVNPVLSVMSTESLCRVNPGTLVLGTHHINAVFSKVCSRIKNLVGTQLSVVEDREGEDAVKAIFLVGGFGENIYMKQELDQSFSHVEVLQPPQAWAAICRGAVLKGLGNGLVVNYISKYNYGCKFATNFNERKHLETDRYYDKIRCVDRAENQMQWFVHRGENLLKEEPVTHEFFFPLSCVQDLKRLVADIYYSDSLKPETRIEKGVRPLCTFEYDVQSESIPRPAGSSQQGRSEMEAVVLHSTKCKSRVERFAGR